jgi:hypothetical protein
MYLDEPPLLEHWRRAASPNSALQRTGTHKVLGRGRVRVMRSPFPRARVLIRRRAAAELDSQATSQLGLEALECVYEPDRISQRPLPVLLLFA